MPRLTKRDLARLRTQARGGDQAARALLDNLDVDAAQNGGGLASQIPFNDPDDWYVGEDVEAALLEIAPIAYEGKSAGENAQLLANLHTNQLSPLRKVLLTAAAENANSILVSGQMIGLDYPTPSNVVGVYQLLVTVIAPTNGKGTISIGSKGTAVKILNSATGPHFAWIRSDQIDGQFEIAIANDQAEEVFLQVTGTTADQNVQSVLPSCIMLSFS